VEDEIKTQSVSTSEFRSYIKQIERELEAAKATLRANNLPVQVDTHCSNDGQTNQHESQIESTPISHEEPSVTSPIFLTPKSVDLERLSSPRLSEEMSDNSNDEVTDINLETKIFEFHGQTSSIAFLERLRKVQQNGISPVRAPTPNLHSRGRTLVRELRKDSYMDQRETAQTALGLSDEEYYPLHAYTFLDTYFRTLHFVHPIIDQDNFIKRCHDLWRGQVSKVTRSFKALYFSVLALGSLTRIWTEQHINGLGRLEWTRLLFEKADLALGRAGSLNDLEGVQAPYIMALVCQHELNPSLAYAYAAMAIRTAFSTGINRRPVFRDAKFPSDSPTLAVSRTWWGLYSLEIELSFTLGRPDMLGSDLYHNRLPPPIGDDENSIIPAMLGLSRIMRETSLRIYLSRSTLTEKLQQANHLEHELDSWVAHLPLGIRPCSSAESTAPSKLRDPYWPKLQMLILRIRKYEKIIVF
jgi:hypothetical protein